MSIYDDVRQRAKLHAEERLQNEDFNEEDPLPRCDLCGERSSDSDAVIDLYENGVSVACVHYEGCRSLLPEWRSDFDGGWPGTH